MNYLTFIYSYFDYTGCEVRGAVVYIIHCLVLFTRARFP